MNATESKKIKIIIVFSIILFLSIVLLGALVHIVINDKKLPTLKIKETDKALRGNILSRNHFTISGSKKLYKAVVDTRNIAPEKRELFIELFSTFSNMDKEEIREKIDSKNGFVTLTYNLDSKAARYVKQLSSQFFALKVIVRYINADTDSNFLHGLEVYESGESRFYPLGETLTPAIGFVQKDEEDGYTTIKGKYGLEMYYNTYLEGLKSTKIVGRRDVRNNIILDSDSKFESRRDGLDIITSISLKLQKSVEKLLLLHREALEAKEIIAAVMDSKTGNILTIASSRRFNPSHIRNPNNLTISAIRHIFEPGSVMKPIIFSLLLQEKLIHKDDIVKTYNGRYKLGHKIISDEHKYPYLSAENIIVHSSNIGISQLAQKLDPLTYFQGLRAFGFGAPSKIDLPHELSGTIPSIHHLKNSVYRATTSYGYGIKVNFFQLLQAYNIFNNDGLLIQPTIGQFIKGETIDPLFYKKTKQVLSPDVAHTMQKILFKTVTKGTGQNAITEGLLIGGKTGTAQIYTRGDYAETYNNSFFGYANDASHHYTIGVTVIEPNPKGIGHYASQSAVPVFKAIVDCMVDEGLLTPLK